MKSHQHFPAAFHTFCCCLCCYAMFRLATNIKQKNKLKVYSESANLHKQYVNFFPQKHHV